MKTKTKLSLILIFLAVAVCALFAACKIGGKTWREILGPAEGQYITYYAGEGSFKNNKNVKNIYYVAGTPTLDNFEDVNEDVTLENYIFKGWYYVELDENGEPVYATDEDRENNIPVLTDREVEFPLTLDAGQHLYLGAKWTRDYLLRYVLYDTDMITIEGEEGDEVIRDGEVFAESNFGRFDTISLTYTNLPVTSKDSTFLEYYVKEGDEYKVLEGGSIAKPTEYDEDDEDPHVSVYCKFISGNWTMVRTASDVGSMYNSSSGGQKYYITADIDCSSVSARPLKQGTFNCIIEGNGHILSNLKFSGASMANGTVCSLFGAIAATTEIHDLTFKDITVTASPRTGYIDVYLIFHSLEDGAVIDGLTIDGATLSLTYSSSGNSGIDNIPDTGSGYNTDNWLFGGFASDAAFTEEYQNAVTYKNLTLIINRVTADQKNITENQEEA